MPRNRSRGIIIRTWMVLAGLWWFHPSDARAQNMIFANPSDIYNVQAGFTNPALISYQESQVTCGMKVFHLGFLEDNSLAFKSGFFSTSIPYLVRGKIGLSLNGQYFNSPMYTQSNFSFAVSQKYLSLFSIGLRGSLFTKSYNRSLFDLDDEADPVFADGTTKVGFSLGGGLFITPLPNLYLSFVIDHLNRPNIALSSKEKYRQPLELSGGIKYGFGNFSTSIYLRKVDQDVSPFFEIEPNISDNWQVRLAYGMQALHLEGYLNVIKGIALGYSYDYPVSSFHGASFGSHQFHFTYFIDKRPGLPTQLDLGNLELPFNMPENDLWFESRFEVYSAVTSLEIIEKRIFRKIDSALEEGEIDYLVNFELGQLDSAANGAAQFFSTKSVGAYYPEVRRVGIFTEAYQTTLEKIDSLMQRNPEIKTEIITTKRSSHRAAGLQNYLIRNENIDQGQVDVVMPQYTSTYDSLYKNQQVTFSNLKPSESLTVVNHEATTFYIFPIYIENYDQEWKLLIYTSQDKVVKEFHGVGQIPPQINWDWKNDDGQFIEPGLYYYTFQWFDAEGRIQQSNPRIIDVRKIKRNLTVTVSKEPRLLEQEVKKIGIRLNR